MNNLSTRRMRNRLTFFTLLLAAAGLIGAMPAAVSAQSSLEAGGIGTSGNETNNVSVSIDGFTKLRYSSMNDTGFETITQEDYESTVGELSGGSQSDSDWGEYTMTGDNNAEIWLAGLSNEGGFTVSANVDDGSSGNAVSSFAFTLNAPSSNSVTQFPGNPNNLSVNGNTADLTMNSSNANVDLVERTGSGATVFGVDYNALTIDLAQVSESEVEDGFDVTITYTISSDN